nr:glutamine synthetase nodule isozyme [Ipomoea batatas]
MELGLGLRSKARTIPKAVKDPSELPKWNYDGSSTGQAPGEDILKAIFRDPFRRGNNILVMCDAYTPAGEPIPTNKRYNAAKIFNHPDVVAEEPWDGIEQEYTLLQKDVNWPLGWPVGGFPGPQWHKWRSYAGQWEFQVGPSVGISAGDEVWVARYILERITEIAGVVLSFDPKPIPGDWNGAGAHTNYRVWESREPRLGLAGTRRKEGKGYFEDRRPASNMDPYVVTSMVAGKTIIWKP